jgi:DinB superfamily
MPRPDLTRMPEYTYGYIGNVAENNIMEAFQNQASWVFKFFKKIPVAKQGYRYAKGKWTLKEMLQHIIDTERVFSYRAICIARKDATHFPGFDENAYADNVNPAKRNWEEMLEELKALRRSNELMFASFTKKQLDSGGIVNGRPAYVLGLGYTMIGHVAHHIKIIKERYL